jgi:sugar phosphate isomerase/epimerase
MRSMLRRTFLATSGLALAAPASKPVRFGVDVFSLRSTEWTPFQVLDYCAGLKVQVVHFSEIRFLGGLEEANLRKIRAYAQPLGLELQIGMRSICPSSKMFEPAQGTAEEQLSRMITAAKVIGSPLVRAVLGSAADRVGPVPFAQHIENTVKVLRAVKSRAVDAGVKIAIENHAGDMQAHELKGLIESAGKDFVGACLDSGNPVWTLEDPHLTLETLGPYALTTHMRDSAVWKVPEGVAVQWTRLGEGNIGFTGYVRRFVELCPNAAFALETIVTGPRIFPVYKPDFWDAYRTVPAWVFARFMALAEKGSPGPPFHGPSKEAAAQAQREDVEASLRWARSIVG